MFALGVSLLALFCLAYLAAAPGANAAFQVDAWEMTPSTTQAGGHPNVSFHLDPNATASDATSDDLKTVKVEFAAGMLANPEATSKCSSSQFSSDTCPSGSQVGTVNVQYKKGGSYFTMPGTVYMLPAETGSVATAGMIVRPSGYQKIFLKTSRVGGIATVRTGVDADYGLDMVFDNIPRTLTTTFFGTQTNITVANVTVNLQNRAGSSPTGTNWFTFNPTRCGAASARMTATSYKSVAITLNSAYTLTGCSTVPFTPTFAAQMDNGTAGAATGIKATVTVPTANSASATAPQQSHVQTITTTLPTGTGLNFPAISAVGALCTDAQLTTNTCPAASKIGTAAVNVPFLPSALGGGDTDPALNGGIYLMTRGSGITFGYVLLGAGSTTVVLKGSATAEDTNGDSITDSVVARLINLPQAPFSSATLDFDTQLIYNPTTGCGSPQTIKAGIAPWSGNAASNLTSTYSLTGCTTEPDTTINSSPASPTSDNTATFTFSSTASGATFQCSVDSAAFAACTSPFTTAALADGSHTFAVRAVTSSGTDSSPATASFIVDTTAPAINIVTPTEGQVLTTDSVSVAFTATDANSITARTCKLDAGAAAACTSPKVYAGLANGAHSVTVTATDAAGNTGTAVRNFTVNVDITPPALSITAPANGSTITTSSTTLTFTVGADATSVTCQLDAGAATACTSPTTYSGLASGSHTITVRATDAAGNTNTQSTTFTVNLGSAPGVSITAPPNGTISNDNTTTITFTTTNSPTSVTCKVDSAAAVACTSPFTTPTLSEGSHTVVVTATNAAGSGSASVTFTIDTLLPTVSITSPANGSTTGTSVSTAFTANGTGSNVTGTTCQLDAGAQTACTTGQAYSGLATGSHTITVRATDQAGNVGSATTTFTVANIPTVTISAPTNGSFTNDTTPSVTFTTTGSPTSVTCATDGGAAAACTSPFTTATLGQGLHSVVVTATNAAGSGSATVNFTVDSLLPTVTITSPANGSTTGTSVTTSFTASGTGSNVTGTTCQLDAGAQTACTTGQAYSGLAVGSHTITVRATDQAGNTGSAATTFTVANIPTVTITAPANNSFTNDTTPDITFTTTGSPTSTTCAVDGGAAAACTSPFTTAALGQGAHNVTVTVSNAAGSNSATVSFTVDSLVPTVSITAPANGSTTGSSVTTAFTAAGTGSAVTGTTCQLDAGAQTACSTGQAYSGLAVGSHTITVRATDQAGNVGSATTTFTVANIPTVTISAPTNGSFTNDTTPSVTFTTTGSPTSVTCATDGGAAAACTSPFTTATLGQGAHSVVVTATNAAGSGSATATFTVDSLVPTVSITAPANGSTTGTSVTTAFTANGTGSNVTGTTCQLDAGAQTACTTGQAYTGLTTGSHTITVRATDQAGNTGSAATTFTVANVPTVTITSPAAGAFTTDTTPDIVFTTTGSPTSVTCATDGGAAAACTSPFTTATLGQGAHSVVVTATNAAGSGSATATFTVDSLVPTVTISSPANGATVGATVQVNFTANGTGSNVTGTTCQVDAGTQTACASGVTLTIPTGAHTITVRATDQAGNVGSATVNVTGASVPTVTITSPTNGATLNDNTPTITFTTTGSPTSVTCATDAGAAAACTSPFTTATLADGNHSVTVTATNAAGSGSSTVTFTIDTALPTVSITAPANGSTTGTSVTLAFTANGTGSAVTGTTCQLDAAAQTACTTGQVYSSLTTGSHTITVRATDTAGNVGQAATTFTVAQIPTVTISAPTNGSFTNDTTPSVTFTTTGSPTSITCATDGGAAAACTSPFTTATLGQGSHSVVVTATNAAGSGSATVTFTVDSLLPTVTITAPANGSTTGTSVTTAFTAAGTGSNVTGTTCQLDAGAQTACTTGQAYSGLATGSHTITVRATDQAGNVGQAATTFTVAQIPTVTITAPPTFTNDTTPDVVFTTTGSPTSITCSTDGGAAAACTSPFTTATLGQGAHSVTVTATNAAGSGSATVNFTVDSLVPTVSITSPANGSTTGAAVTTAFTANGTGTSVTGTTCQLDAGAQTACSTGQAYSGLAVGSHTITVRATDQAGNVGSAATTFTVANLPTVTITAPPNNGFTNDTTPDVVFTTTGSPTSTTCAVDGGAASACTSPFTAPTLGQGAHTVVVTVSNAAGSNSATVNFTVDSLVPTVSITAPANGSTTGTSVTTAFTANGTGTSVTGTTCQLDAGAQTACTTGQAYSGLASGSHTITVRATDQAGNTGSSATTFTVAQVPTVTLGTVTSPTSDNTPTITFTTTGSPTSVTCKVDAAAAAACTSPFTTGTLADGAHTIVVTATNAAGSGSATANITVDATAPAVAITAPANGATNVASPVTVTFTATDGGTGVASRTCKVDAAAAVACTSPFAAGALASGSHTVVVTATDGVGNTGSATSTFTVAPTGTPPTSVTFTDKPGPSTNDTTPSVSFTSSGGTPAPTFTCSVDGGAAAACTSPFTTPALSDTTIHSITVTATNASGSVSATTYTQVDTRTYGVTVSVTKEANSLTPLANVNLPAAHPNVTTAATLTGAADTKKLTIVLPHGLSGSLASIPAAQRCTVAQANAGTCPASSIVGQGTGTVVTTDSATPVSVTGTGYLMVAPTTADAAGLALKATIAGGRGDIIATGGVQLTNNGSNQQLIADNIPTTSTTGVAFHATALNVTLNGDTDRSNGGVQGANGHPLITNQSSCFTPTGTAQWAPYNASTNALGYKGPFVNVNATLDSYSSTTATANPAYTVTGCSATVPQYNPGVAVTLSSSTPGTLSKAVATLTVPAESATLQRISSKLPPKFGPNLPSFGAGTDMCPGTAATTGTSSYVGIGNTPFDRSACPAQSRYGQVVINTPLLTNPVIGNVYLINKIPLPWLGVHIDPTISPNNPQGVTADLLFSTGLPYVNTTCSTSGDGCPNGSGPGTGICDLDFETCQQQISVAAAGVPDIPITSTVLYLGQNADGSDIAGRVGVGGITSNFPLQIAPAGDNTCATGENPDAVTPGTPYVQNAVTQLTPWSTTTATGTGTFKTVNTTIATPGC